MTIPFRTLCFLCFLAAATSSPAQVLPAPDWRLMKAYDSHIEMRWKPLTGATAYEIYRSTDDGQAYQSHRIIGANDTSFIDWIGDEGVAQKRFYQVRALKSGVGPGVFSAPASAQTQPAGDEALLDMVQEYTFRYFWDFAHPVSGMARERNTSGDIVTTGGTGFGIMALLVGVERGWITREQAISRMIQIVSFLQFADRFHGVYPHWMNGVTGDVVPFSTFDDGGDLVETAFLIQGLLAARTYFNQNTPLEKAVRDVITGIWEDVEWDWHRKDQGNVLYWHWSPNHAWKMNFPLRGFFEAQVVYLLALASPTHSVPASLYQNGWMTPGYTNSSIHFGHPVYCGPFGGGPLFFAHYSYLGFDPRFKKDACCNYYIRNRNHSLIQQAYCKANPENHAGYSDKGWGLTSCDGPNGYFAHDITPGGDRGTIAPTAALSSMPYTPSESLAALKYFYRELGEKLWGKFGFYDAFNLDQNWFASSYIAIDQGPIIGMIENYRSGLLWEKFMQNPEIAPALTAAGFTADGSAVETPEKEIFDFTASPNPLHKGRVLEISISNPNVKIRKASLTDSFGRSVLDIPNPEMIPDSGTFIVHWPFESTGIYFLTLTAEDGTTRTKKLAVEKN